MATTNLVPTIESATLPQTPASEWAESTNNILNAHKPSTPLDKPGPPIPKAFPEEQAPEQGGETLVDTAKAYLPAQEDVQRAMANAAKAYLPERVAAYIPASESELAPPRPPFLTDDTSSGLSNLSTEAQAGSLMPPLTDSSSTLYLSRNPTESAGNLSTTVHTGTPASLHPVSPLPSSTDGLSTPHTTSLAPLSSASEVLSRDFDFPAPPTGGLSSSQSEGVPAPQNSLASTHDSEPLAGPDIVPPPHGVFIPGSTALNSSRPEDNLPSDSTHADDELDTPPDVEDDAAPSKTKFVRPPKKTLPIGKAQS